MTEQQERGHHPGSRLVQESGASLHVQKPAWHSKCLGTLLRGCLHAVHLQPHAAVCLGCCAAGWFWLQQQHLPLIIYGSAAHMSQRQVALPAVGESSSVTRGNKCCASLGSCAQDLRWCFAALGYFECADRCKGLDLGFLGPLPLEEVCGVTARKKGVHTEKRQDTDPGCGLKLSQKRNRLRIYGWRRRIQFGNEPYYRCVSGSVFRGSSGY